MDHYGLRSYKEGLFWLVNPNEYNDHARKFSSVTKNAIVFARSNMGNLFLLENLEIGDFITFLNIHEGTTKVISTNFQVLLPFHVPTNSFWKEDCYGKFELEAIKKSKLAPDECWTFEPPLALGGDKKLSNLRKVKTKENIELLAQLLS